MADRSLLSVEHPRYIFTFNFLLGGMSGFFFLNILFHIYSILYTYILVCMYFGKSHLHRKSVILSIPTACSWSALGRFVLFIKDCRALFDLSSSRNVIEYHISSWRQAQAVYSREGYSKSVPTDFNPHIYLINKLLLNVFLHSENVSQNSKVT